MPECLSRDLIRSSDTGKLAACFDITAAGWPIDHPDEPCWSFDSFAGKWAHGFDTAPRQTWLATDSAGDPVGCYLLRLPDRENQTMAYCHLAVHPAARRAGIGTALLAHCAGQAREAGRSRLVGQARDDSPGAAFAVTHGARAGIPEVGRVLDIDGALPARLADLRASTRSRTAAGYSSCPGSGRPRTTTSIRLSWCTAPWPMRRETTASSPACGMPTGSGSQSRPWPSMD